MGNYGFFSERVSLVGIEETRFHDKHVLAIRIPRYQRMIGLHSAMGGHDG